MKVKFKSSLVFSSLLSVMFIVTGCQEKPAPQQETVSTESKSSTIPLLQAQVERVELPKKQFCDEDGCTQYDFQTVKTNVSWINDYFLERIKKDVPSAFETSSPNSHAASEAVDIKGLNQSSI